MSGGVGPLYFTRSGIRLHSGTARVAAVLGFLIENPTLGGLIYDLKIIEYK
jgi:hypothetical protein